jgi:hypothetical protein
VSEHEAIIDVFLPLKQICTDGTDYLPSKYWSQKHNNAHAHRLPKVDRLWCRGDLRRVMGTLSCLRLWWGHCDRWSVGWVEQSETKH